MFQPKNAEKMNFNIFDILDKIQIEKIHPNRNFDC